MFYCPKCNAPQDENGPMFCSSCGNPFTEADLSLKAPRQAVPKQAQARAKAKSKAMVWLVIMSLVPIIIIGVVLVVLGKGCSSTEGEMTSQGSPFGDFTFVPVECHNAKGEGVFGVTIHSKEPGEGNIFMFVDHVRGKFVKVRLPGTCQPPDYHVCEEKLVAATACSLYEISVRDTGNSVRNVQLLDGHLKLDCQFEEGGTLTADISLSNCD
jgi:hypothetical protein